MASNKKLEMAIEIAGKVDKSLDNSINRANNKLNSIGKIAKKVAAVALAAFATLQIGSFFKDSVQQAMQFESSMADVVKVVDGLRDSSGRLTNEYYLMKDALIDLSKKIPLTADELAVITANAGQAGITGREELIKFTEQAAKMATAFDVTADIAGDWMAKWRTSFKMSQDEVTDLADKINYLGNTGAANSTQISEIVTKIGPLGDVAGVASGEIAALGAAIAGVGVNEDVAATGIKNMMTRMVAGSSATKAQIGVLSKLGISATDLAERMQVDAKGAIIDFLSAVKKLPKAQQAASLKNFFGSESVGAIAPLLSNLENLEEQFYKVSDASIYSGSMEQEFAARADTTENKLILLKNSFNAIKISIGNMFIPYLAKGAEALANLLDKTEKFIKENKEVIKTVAKTGTAFLGVVVAGTTLGSLLGGLIASTVLFGTKMKVAKGATAGFVKGIKGVGKNVLSFGKLFTGTIGTIVSNTIGKFAIVQSAFSKLVLGFIATRRKIFGVFTGLFSKVAGFIKPLITGIASVFGKMSFLLTPLTNAIGMFKMLALFQPTAIILGIGAVISLISIFTDNLDNVRNLIQNVFGDKGVAIFDKFVSIFKNIGTTLKNVFSDAGLQQISKFIEDTFGSKAAAIFNKLIPVIQVVRDVITQFVQFSLTYIKPVVNDILSFIIGTLLPTIISYVQQWLPVILNIFKGAAQIFMGAIAYVLTVFQVYWPLISNVVMVAVNTIGSVIGGLLNIISGIIDFIVGIFTGNWAQAWEGVKQIFKGIMDSLVGIAKTPINAVIGLINGVIGGINNLGIDIPDWVPGLGGKSLSINIPKIPMLAKGGITTGPTLAMIGEGAEQEAVLPLSKLQNLINLNQQPLSKEYFSSKLEQFVSSNNENVENKFDNSRSTSNTNNKAYSNSDNQIIYSPQIVIQGNADKEVVQQALKVGYDDFKRFMDKYNRENKRRSFA